MVRDLSCGELPDEQRLRGWFRAALTKKLAIVSLPPAFWENDPKRNPDTIRLLWAATLLKDLDGCRCIQIVMATEKDEQGLEKSVEKRIEDGLNSLLELGATAGIREFLQERVHFIKNHL